MAALAERGIAVVALSKDSPDEAALQEARDGLRRVRLWSDDSLAVIKSLGALHRGAVEFKTWLVSSVPLGVPTGFAEMAVPTTLLVDEDGVIRWIDQADDYRIRSDDARITAALEQIGW